jgi:hypothetical protein
VQAEAVRVHSQGGAAAVHHFPHNVHLHLGSRQGYLPWSHSLSLATDEWDAALTIVLVLY